MAEDQNWQAAPGSLVLPPDEVHVWRLHLDVGPEALERLSENLSVDERARAARFHAALHRTRYTVARGVLRNLLSSYLGIPPATVAFTQNAHGKPSLTPSGGIADLRFNLSHSHD